MPDTINMQSTILMHYSIMLSSNNIIESNFNDEPVKITLGQDEISEGMELALFGLKEGETQTLTLTAEQSFGVPSEDNINLMPIEDFPKNFKPVIGKSFSFESPTGQEIPGTITKLNKKTVEVDFNHPLAGQEIIFKVHILDIDNTK